MALENLLAGGSVVQSLAPAARNATANGSSADLAGFQACEIVVGCGAITDGTHTPSVQESDDNSSFTAVAAGDLIGALAACTANAVQRVAYKGGKRYVRVVMTIAGATTGALTSAHIVRGRPVAG
jgi:hypothetical protein